MFSLGRDELLRIVVAGVLLILIIGEEFGKQARFALLSHWRRIGIDETQRLRQPARAIEKALGLLCHIGLLQMVDQLRRRLALRFPHGFQNTRLGDPAEIVVDGRSPASLHNVEPDRGRASTSTWSRRVRTP